MSRYGALSRGPDGVLTAGDLACWRTLIAEARKAAAAEPSAPAKALGAVARASKSACAPGVVSRENACVQLSRLARRYMDETTAGRRELRAALAAAADAAELVLPDPEAPTRKPRADIDG